MATEKPILEQLLLNIPDYIQRVKCDTNKWTKPFKCAVTSCGNKFKNFRESSKYPYKFHNFPVQNETLCKIWKVKCGLDETKIVHNMMVCSDHFCLDDYTRNYREEFLNPNFRRVLNDTAIPTNNLPKSKVEGELSVNEEQSEDLKYDKIEVTDDTSEIISGKDDCPNLSKVNDALEENISLMKHYNNLLQQQTKLRKQIDSDKKLLDNMKKRKLVRKKRYDDTSITKLFSPAQIQLLQGRKQKIVWSHDDLAQAFTMRHMGGKECYLYLKNSLALPLPALSCVQKWAAAGRTDVDK